MVRVKLKYVQRITARGRIYYYFRRHGRRVRLPDIEDPGFLAAYHRLLHEETRPLPAAGTMAALVLSYRQSPEYRALKPSSRRTLDYYLDLIVEEHGHKLAARLTRGKVVELRDRLADTPGKANRYVSALSVLMRRAIDLDWRSDNPCTGVAPLQLGEYQPWPPHVWRAALERASPMLRLALVTLYYSGQRVSDAVRILRRDVECGRVELMQKKTGKRVSIPVHTAWREEICRVPPSSTGLTLLYNRYGRPLTEDALQERWRRLRTGIRADGYHLHGLRKNACCSLAEAGCTAPEIASITGQSLQMVEYYIRQADSTRLAQRAVARWERNKNGNWQTRG